jgi:transposase-like protein
MDRMSIEARPRRREYNAQFKASVLEQCRQAGNSVAGVALGHGLNPNMVHRWIREERQRQAIEPAGDRRGDAFVALPLVSAPPDHEVAPALAQVIKSAPGADDIRLEIQRAGATIRIHWPVSAAAECATWLRELLR